MDAAPPMTDPLHSLGEAAHVWLARPEALADAALQARCRGLLSEDEIARHGRLRSAAVRALFLTAHAMKRSALSHYGGVSPESWRFEANAWGRPEITGPAGAPPLRFNLSHTTGLAACVVTRDADCGVDVESLDRRRDPRVPRGSHFPRAMETSLWLPLHRSNTRGCQTPCPNLLCV